MPKLFICHCLLLANIHFLYLINCCCLSHTDSLSFKCYPVQQSSLKPPQIKSVIHLFISSLITLFFFLACIVSSVSCKTLFINNSGWTWVDPLETQVYSVLYKEHISSLLISLWRIWMWNKQKSQSKCKISITPPPLSTGVFNRP